MFEWWYLIFILVAVVAESVFHEASHALVAFSLGYSNIKIYPCRLRVAGHWAFGGFSYQYKTQHHNEWCMWIAPIWMASFILITTVILTILTKNVIPLIFMACAVIDIMVWLKGYFWGSLYHDGQRYKRLR
jgi:hypothetical protein